MKRDSKGRFIKGSNGDTFEGYGKWYDKFGYPSIWVDNKSVMLHVYIWERYNGERPLGYHVHHIDGNKGNYNIENLICLSPSDHQKIHNGWKKKDGEWFLKPCKECKQDLELNLFYQRKGLTPSNVCIKCTKKIANKKLKDDLVFREKRRQYLKEYYKRKQNEQ